MICVYLEPDHASYLMLDNQRCQTDRAFGPDVILDAYGSLSGEPAMEPLNITASYASKCERIALASVPSLWRSIIQSTIYRMRAGRG